MSPTRTLLRVWAALLALTALEVWLACLRLPSPLLLAALLGVSIGQAWLVLAWFMNLRFEKFRLVLALIPMLVVCVLLLLLVLPDAARLNALGTP